jgi:hypothetical protein
MNVTFTHTSGAILTMPWRPEGRKPYTGTAASFLYNLPRADCADWTVTTEDGRAVPMSKARAAAAAEMNAIRNGQRIPALPQL